MTNKLADLAQKAEPAFWLPGHPTDTLRSTIGGGALNCRVRHGTGWPHSLVTHRITNTKTTPRMSSGPFFKLILATTYSDTQTSRLAQIRKSLIWLPGHPTDTLRSTTRDGVLYCRVRHETGQTSLIPRYLTASHKTKQEREVSLDFPLSLKLIPAPIYSPTDTLRSTIDDGVLNCRVRHGTGWIHSSITTRNFYISPLRRIKDL